MDLYKTFSMNNVVLTKFPFKMELVMESFLIENEKVLELPEYDEFEIITSELPLQDGRKKKNTDGRIDLLGLYGDDTLGIIELKKGKIDVKAFEQLKDYFDEKEQVLNKIKDDERYSYLANVENVKWIGILVGTSISDKLMDKIKEGEKISGDIPVSALVINRYKSDDGQIFVTTDLYTTPSGKHKEQYIFDGGQYGKGQCVLAVVKKFCKANPDITFDKLQEIFSIPKKDIVEKIEIARAKDTDPKHPRYFKYDKIKIGGEDEILVSNQWSIDNFPAFKDHVQKTLGYKIDEVKD